MAPPFTLADVFPTVWFGFLPLGLAVGSFLNVVIHRLPVLLERRWQCEARLQLAMAAPDGGERYDLWRPLSRCPHCRRPIAMRDNIPLLSWLLLRGRGRCCGQLISWRYPLVEALTGLLFVAAGARWPPGGALFGALVLLSFLLALAVIDAQTLLLPDALTLPLLWLGLSFNLSSTWTTPANAVIGAMAGYGALRLLHALFKALTGRDALGLGDCKLLAALGAWLGWQALPYLVLTAALAGTSGTLLWRWRHGGAFARPLAFGPWLAAGGGAILFAADFIG